MILIWHLEVVINQLKWENKLLQTEIKEMQKMNDITNKNGEEKDEVKEISHHYSFKVGDW